MSISKEVIYIDIEDDITSIIGKLKSSSKRIVAMVPPKRASVFTSFVNLKLLKKAATDANKRLVIVTADDSLRALAGTLGLYVAKNLNTPPEVPSVEDRPAIPSAVIQASGVAAPVGAEAAAVTADKPAKKMKPVKSDKKLPNFTRFRKQLLIGGGVLVALLLLWWWAFFIAPTAEVVISADQTRIRSEFDLQVQLDGQSTESEDDGPALIAGQRQSVDIQQTATAEATGEKNKGKKASGDMTIFNDTLQVRQLQANTRFRASNGLIFRLDSSVTLPPCNFGISGCASPSQTGASVTADQPGDEYNIAPSDYVIPGLDDSLQSRIYGEGAAMGGGTTDIVSVLTDEDVERALNSLTEGNASRDEIFSQLREQFSGEVYLFEETLSDRTRNPEVSPKVGSETDESQVVATQTYSIVGVSREEFETVLREQYESELTPQQAVTNTGIDELVPSVQDNEDDRALFSIVANGLAGPDLDMARLKDELSGMPYSEALTYIEDLPSVNGVEIELNPVWVGRLPRSAAKIDISIDSAGLTAEPDQPSPEPAE